MRVRILLSILALALGGCVSGAPPAPSGGSAESAAPGSESAAPDLTRPAAEPGGVATASPTNPAVPRRGGTLRVGLSSEISTLDPHYSTSAADRQIYYALYNTLVGLDAQLRVVPELTETVDQPDAKMIRFRLRQGVKFHDGTDFDAAAVKFNFERMLDPNGGSIRRSELGNIDTVETPDSSTVVLRLKAPDASLLATLTDRAGMMISPAGIQKYGKYIARNPIGSGPFKLVEWVKDDHLTVRRNEAYWRSPLPLLDEIQFKPFVDRAARLAELRSGTLDIVDELAPTDVAAARAAPDLEVSQVAGLGYRRIQLNTTRPPFDSMALRQSIAAAIDREAIQRAVFSDTGAPAQGPLPPGSWAFNKDFSGWGNAADVGTAKSKLQEAGRPDGFSFSYLTENDPLQLQLAQLVQEQLRKAGIEAKLEVGEPAALIIRRTEGSFEAIEQNWPGRVDPDSNLYSNFLTGAANNWGRYSSPRVDELLKAARLSTSVEERARAYQEAESIISREAAVVFLHHEAWIKAWTRKLRDYQELADGRFRFEKSWLAE